MINPKYELINFRYDNKIKNGSKSIVAGNIWVVNNDNIPNCLPLNLNRDKAYPLVEANTTPVNVTTKVTIKEFHAQFRNGVSVKSVL